MTDTSGFYKNDNGTLLYAGSAVIGVQILLVRELKDTYEYPIDGWTWFESEDAARTAYDLPAPLPPEPPQIPGMNAVDVPPVIPMPPLPPLTTGPTSI